MRKVYALSCAALATLIGCGRGDYPEIARVSGTVTHAGKPVPNLAVNFMPEEGRPSWGITDASGKYSLTYDEDYEGAKVGRHKIYVFPRQTTIDGSKSKEAVGGIGPDEMKTILDKYGNEEKSTLVVEVKDDPSVIDLKLD